MKREIFATRMGPRRGPLAIDPKALDVAYEVELEIETEITHENGVAIVDVRGPLAQRACGFDGYDAVIERFRMACASARCVLLTIGSPGGEVEGLFEACRVLRQEASRTGTPVVAYVDESAYSAAYALACVADAIYLPPAGGVGSIGVIGELVSVAEQLDREGVAVEVITSGEQKADGHPNAPITDGARARAQARVDQLAQLFFSWVSVRRGLTVAEIEAMDAACLYGDSAVAAGLADGIKSRAGALAAAKAMATEL